LPDPYRNDAQQNPLALSDRHLDDDGGGNHRCRDFYWH